MIPVTILDNEGKVAGQQAFNDNLTPQEEINRILLDTYYKCQMMLTNTTNGVSVIIGKGDYTAKQLSDMKAAALTMHTAVISALETFKAAVEAE